MFTNEIIEAIKERLIRANIDGYDTGNIVNTAIDDEIEIYGHKYMELVYNGDSVPPVAWAGGGHLKIWQLLVSIYEIQQLDQAQFSRRFSEDLIEDAKQVVKALQLWYMPNDPEEWDGPSAGYDTGDVVWYEDTASSEVITRYYKSLIDDNVDIPEGSVNWEDLEWAAGIYTLNEYAYVEDTTKDLGSRLFRVRIASTNADPLTSISGWDEYYPEPLMSQLMQQTIQNRISKVVDGKMVYNINLAFDVSEALVDIDELRA